MISLIKKLLSYKFTRFVLAGGTSVVFNLCSRAIFSIFFSYQIAIILAYIVGMITAWSLMRVLVFRTVKERVDGEILRFFIVNMIGLTQVSVVSVLLLDRLYYVLGSVFYSEMLAHFIGLISIVFTSFILHSKFTYRSKSSH